MIGVQQRHLMRCEYTTALVSAAKAARLWFSVVLGNKKPEQFNLGRWLQVRTGGQHRWHVYEVMYIKRKGRQWNAAEWQHVMSQARRHTEALGGTARHSKARTGIQVIHRYTETLRDTPRHPEAPRGTPRHPEALQGTHRHTETDTLSTWL